MKVIGLVLAIGLLSGCQSAYYAAWEKLGVEKRDILVDRVEEAKESQEDAQEQFASALDEFSQLINFDGGELQTIYDELSSEFNDSEAAAANVSERINKVESVAEALFEEWENELESYTNAKLRNDSEQRLQDTKRRYTSLISSMRKAESRMEPVLSALRDNVLYLKHNLNASAVGALQTEFNDIKGDIDLLIEEMSAAIAQSNDFISSIRS